MGVIGTGKLSQNLAGGCVSPFLLRQVGANRKWLFILVSQILNWFQKSR